jgi:nucleoside-diphosphate-sugar epimerase
LKTLLIIGGTGFFGNSILKYFSNTTSLKRKFNKLIIISRKNFYKFDYLKKLKKNYKVLKINCDISKIKKLPYADFVIYASILKDFKKDHLAIKNYINLAKLYHRRSKILYTSSGAVYGKQKNNIKSFKENYLAFNKKNSFGRSYKKEYSYTKLKNERLFKQLAESGLNVSIARCFTFVGEFILIKRNLVIRDIIQSIIDKKDIKINANYKILRSYMYSDDLVNWLLKILYSSNKSCPIYNVGSDNVISIEKIINTLAKKYNLKVKKQNIISKNIIDKYIPNVQKAKKILNLKINFDSCNSILKTIKLIKNNNSFSKC